MYNEFFENLLLYGFKFFFKIFFVYKMEKLINTNYKYGIDIIIIEILILSLKYDSNYNNIHHYIY